MILNPFGVYSTVSTKVYSKDKKDKENVQRNSNQDLPHFIFINFIYQFLHILTFIILYICETKDQREFKGG